MSVKSELYIWLENLVVKPFGLVVAAMNAFILLLAFGAYIVGIAAALTFFFVGFWDLLVWLTNADWKTTNFLVPKWAFIISLASFFLAYLMSEISPFFDDLRTKLMPPEDPPRN